MPIEKVSAGPAMQRPQPTTQTARPPDVVPASEEQAPGGGAPAFDHAAGKPVTPKAGMLANPIVQKFTSGKKEEGTAEQGEVENVDAGAIQIKGQKKPTRKPAPPKKSQKRGGKRS